LHDAAGFYDGVFLVGACAGEKVSDGKTKIRQLLLDAAQVRDADHSCVRVTLYAQAIIYWEPASLVMSRSGDECVVCLTDQVRARACVCVCIYIDTLFAHQWYIDYAQPEWKKQVIELVRSMDTFGDDLRAVTCHVCVSSVCVTRMLTAAREQRRASARVGLLALVWPGLASAG
jgi:leucyl-tRNA synthetase